MNPRWTQKSPQTFRIVSFLHFTGQSRLLRWWRRRELNPRPKIVHVKRLHAYSRVASYRARNRSGTECFVRYPAFVSPWGRPAAPLGYPASRRPIPIPRERKGGTLAMQPERKSSRLRLSLCSTVLRAGRDLGMQSELRYPRRIRFAPLVFYLYLPTARSISRSVSFFFSDSRLSCSFLPRARPMASFALPALVK